MTTSSKENKRQRKRDVNIRVRLGFVNTLSRMDIFFFRRIFIIKENNVLNKSRGYSLIEMVVVMLVTAILISISIPVYNRVINTAYDLRSSMSNHNNDVNDILDDISGCLQGNSCDHSNNNHNH